VYFGVAFFFSIGGILREIYPLGNPGRFSARLNGTPRKCLGYATPAEAFAKEMKRIT
jgi:hypothetical protein